MEIMDEITDVIAVRHKKTLTIGWLIQKMNIHLRDNHEYPYITVWFGFALKKRNYWGAA